MSMGRKIIAIARAASPTRAHVCSILHHTKRRTIEKLCFTYYHVFVPIVSFACDFTKLCLQTVFWSSSFVFRFCLRFNLKIIRDPRSWISMSIMNSTSHEIAHYYRYDSGRSITIISVSLSCCVLFVYVPTHLPAVALVRRKQQSHGQTTWDNFKVHKL